MRMELCSRENKNGVPENLRARETVLVKKKSFSVHTRRIAPYLSACSQERRHLRRPNHFKQEPPPMTIPEKM